MQVELLGFEWCAGTDCVSFARMYCNVIQEF